ncbi:uncharacterized protein involved in response to NO [Cribrihabitans marinus]|uniref:Uncharacterized protein involved in response to NO n=1 Tax=Cribrihabitans marinus TaxID=1227549 RepID=A0A1H7DLZ8_9RHOB|nr:NnrS family protein [Cribrihabitans marinus]SEK02831.1 uncharacterized protein involved in response to NO [Cribrihabitans marinus]
MTALTRIFTEGFRIFFLAAGLFGVFAIAVWSLDLAGLADAPGRSVSPLGWHAHEMVFGYATAAIGGFFLTAVPNWTGAPGARQGYIALAAGLWLAGRIAVWYAGALPPVWVAVLDLAFIPVLSLKLLSQLVKRPKPQNMMFLLFLGLIWAANLMVHLDWIGAAWGDAGTGLRAGLLAVCAMISVLGGRVTPAFTRNAMKREGVDEARWPVSDARLEKAALILSLALPLLVLLPVAPVVTAAVALVFGLAQIARLARWRWRWCLTRPILLALHMGLAMLAAGLVLWGLAGLGLGSEVAALHVLGIGAVGGMTLAVMSRAVLGHSGRDLVAPGPVAAGYAMIACAGLLRWVAGTVPTLWLAGSLMAGLLWVLAFGLFVAALWPALTGPRVAG